MVQKWQSKTDIFVYFYLFLFIYIYLYLFLFISIFFICLFIFYLPSKTNAMLSNVCGYGQSLPEWSFTFQVLHSWVGSWPYPKLLEHPR